jgi:hypothetical protein
MTVYAVTVDLDVPGGVDDDAVNGLLEALKPYSGALAIESAEQPSWVSVAVDISAPDVGAATVRGLAAARTVLNEADLPYTAGAVTGIRVLTVRAQEQELLTPVVPPLVGLSEVADMFGISRQRVTQLRERVDFPDPVAVLRSGPVWTAPALQHFLTIWDRTPGRRTTSVR